MGQRRAHGDVLEHLAVLGSSQVKEYAVFCIPKLIVAPVVNIPVAARVCAGQGQIGELELIPDIRCVGGGKQGNGLGADGQSCLAPPVCALLQAVAHSGGLQHIGAGANGPFRAYLAFRQNGNVQQHRQVFVGYIQSDNNGLSADRNFIDVEEAAGVVFAFLGGVQACHHILGGDRLSVGERGVFQGEGVGLHILGNGEVLAKLGLHVVVPVNGKQTLIQQGKQRPVGKIVALVGVERLFLVVSQTEIFSGAFLLGGGLGAGVIVVVMQAVTGGGVGIAYGLSAAAKEKRQAQNRGKEPFHLFSSFI